MLFEEATRGVDERVVRDRIDQMVNASFDVFRRFGLLDGIGEDDFEGFERELVHRMDAREIVHDEVDQTGACRGRPVEFAGFVDFHRGDLRLADFLFDFRGGALGVFEILDEFRVAEKVRACRRKAGQEIVLETFERDFEFVLLLGQVGFQALEIRTFLKEPDEQRVINESLASLTLATTSASS